MRAASIREALDEVVVERGHGGCWMVGYGDEMGWSAGK
jgi:hypothetical protein